MLALAVRVVAFTVPLGASFLVIRVLAAVFWRPAGLIGLLCWIVQAATVGFVVSVFVDRGARRLLPLATLLDMSLVFPDQAPSRFGVALRSGTVRRLRERLEQGTLLAANASDADAAACAIELIAAVADHDRLTRGHTERVRAYADLIGEELDLAPADRQRLSWAVLLHDVGKLTVPPEVLNKTEKLTDEEWGVLRNHPEASRAMVEPMRAWLGDWVLAAPEHHERWDGTGYPSRLAGTEISLAGRIASVADAYDVITTKRSYKEPMTPQAARRELVACAGTQFDPGVVRAFMNVSLGRRWMTGPLAWLTQLPIGQLTTTATSAPAVAGMLAAGSLFVAPPDPPAHPAPVVDLAFADEPGADSGAFPTPTPTATLRPGQPTPTPTATLRPGQPTPTATLRPGQPTPTPTPTLRPGQPTPTPTATLRPGQPTPTPSSGPGVPPPTRTPIATAVPTATAIPTATPTSTPTPSPTPTPIPGGLTYGGHTYVAGSTGLTWTQAHAEAQAMGGHLVTITSQGENDFVRATFGSDSAVWLGLRDADSTNAFTAWVTGEPVAYTRWAPAIPLVRAAQPNHGSGEDYVQMIDDSGRWADVKNGETQWFLGLIPMSASPALTVIEFDH